MNYRNSLQSFVDDCFHRALMKLSKEISEIDYIQIQVEEEDRRFDWMRIFPIDGKDHLHL
jgi:hypothetical protein